MKKFSRNISIGLLLFFLNACSAGTMVSSSALRSDPEIYRVGELEVRLYQDQERMSRDLPPSIALAGALKIGAKQLQILGYYDEKNKRIFSINDARVLLHEIKHYLEPHWRHEVGADYLEALRKDVRSACVDCLATAPLQN
jgi:hypothetical protein